MPIADGLWFGDQISPPANVVVRSEFQEGAGGRAQPRCRRVHLRMSHRQFRAEWTFADLQGWEEYLHVLNTFTRLVVDGEVPPRGEGRDKCYARRRMDFVIDLDPTHLVLRVTVRGTLTDEGSIEIYRVLARFASRGGPYAAITDLSQVVDFQLSSDTVRALATTSPAVPGPSVIVASEPALYGLARMGELIRDSMGKRLLIMRAVDEAYELLKVTPADFSQRLYPEDLVG